MDVDEILGLGVDISEKIRPHEWEKLPWRWVVERTLSWRNNSRRLSKDYEISTACAEAIVKISHLTYATQTIVNTGSITKQPGISAAHSGMVWVYKYSATTSWPGLRK